MVEDTFFKTETNKHLKGKWAFNEKTAREVWYLDESIVTIFTFVTHKSFFIKIKKNICIINNPMNSCTLLLKVSVSHSISNYYYLNDTETQSRQFLAWGEVLLSKTFLCIFLIRMHCGPKRTHLGILSTIWHCMENILWAILNIFANTFSSLSGWGGDRAAVKGQEQWRQAAAGGSGQGPRGQARQG